MNQKTAILFFARTPELEARAKSWTKSKSLNLRLSTALHKQVSSVLEQSNLPIVIADENKQSGANFHEKITNALADFYDMGYDNAIVVGSDCADLSVEDIEKAEANFHLGKYTYGSSYDGGVYLFTLSKTDFAKDELLALPWCTNKLSVALLEKTYAHSSCSVDELGRKLDLDRNLSQLKTLSRFTSRFFRKLILTILSICSIFVTKKANTTTLSPSILFNKGSPFSLS